MYWKKAGNVSYVFCYSTVSLYWCWIAYITLIHGYMHIFGTS